MSQISIDPDPSGRGGFAQIRIQGAAQAAADPRFRLQRSDERAGFLGTQGWQPAEALLSPRSAHIEGSDLLLEIGPEVVDLVEDGTIGFGMPAAGVMTTVIWPILTPSYGGLGSVISQTQRSGADVVLSVHTIDHTVPDSGKFSDPGMRGTDADPTIALRTTSAPPTPDAITRSILPPDPPATVPPPSISPVSRTPSNGPSILVLSLIGLSVLAALGGGLYWFLGTRSAPPRINQSHSTTTPPPPATADDCDAKPLPALFACETDPAKLLAIGEARWKAGHTREGLVIEKAAAQKNFGPAALELATIYDPAHFQASKAVPVARVGKAADYYRQAVHDGDQDAVAPRAKLFRLLEDRADQGDITAPLILKNFWR
ncbi:MAG: hypothetical protein PHT60_11540 [Acidiphilium sp.]|nr:hypothetical protein [Acidiphilium sp.]MDD4936396.1 hypothetical protein [Acidiphilium sp.]